MTEKYVNTNSDEVNDLTKVSIVNAGAPPTVSGEKVLFFSTLINSEDQNSQNVKSYPVKVQQTPKPWAQAPDKNRLNHLHVIVLP